MSVLLHTKPGRVAVVIEDDGRGFAADTPSEDGIGLVGMRERIALVGGRLELETSEGRGTTIVVEVPAE